MNFYTQSGWLFCHLIFLSYNSSIFFCNDMWTYHFPVLNFHIHSWFFYKQLRHLHRLRCQSIGYWLHQLLNLMWISGTQCLALFTETLETAVNPNLRITQTIACVDLNTLKKMCYGFVAWVIMLDFQLISRSPVTSYQI